MVVDHVHEHAKESIGMLVQLVEPFTSLGGKGRGKFRESGDIRNHASSFERKRRRSHNDG